MFYYDYTYLLFIVPVLIFSLIASAKVNSTFKKYSTVMSRRGMTAADAARRILDANGLYRVPVAQTSGKLTDHYDPRTNTVYLSESVCMSTSVAAIGVAAHEVGHAVQHAEGYAPVKIRTAIVPVTNIASRLSIWLIPIGLILSYTSSAFLWIAYLGAAGFSLCVIFQLVTLPTEFDASRRAISELEGGMLDEDEVRGAKKVLSAAAMTYVAALATAVMQLLRILYILNRRRD